MNYPNGKPDCIQPEYPILFLKPASGLTGAESRIQIPPVAGDVAYEAELVLVIGSRARYVTEEKALDDVAGYTMANDVGARDLEKRSSQWTSGKLMDTFTPLGPALVTPDEVPDPGDLPVVTLLNGQVVQRGNTRELFFSVPELVSYVSQLTTLEPGDLILTGSPKTVDGQPAPFLSLHPGDFIEITIGNLGTLCNPVVAEQPDGWKA
jgi:acylpyruvate hydrolase